MNQLLCIVGPTGTGKTTRATQEFQKNPSIIISADSRQVYRGMDIVTGKDHPKNILIYGIDILNPDEQCSVSVWYDSVIPHIVTAWEEDKQVIIVGGTGLYVTAITNGIATMKVPINLALRKELEPLSISELQQKLHVLDEEKFTSMNHSDVCNPRRLIRAIEIAIAPTKLQSTDLCKHESKIIGLKYFDDRVYRSKVHERVLSRLSQGAIEETKKLLAKYDRSLQSMSAIGYKSIVKYLENTITESEMIEEWVSGELAYAKRQMTWFRKQPVIWYDVDTYGHT
jgi:tRNA dimethylallyltransferase